MSIRYRTSNTTAIRPVAQLTSRINVRTTAQTEDVVAVDSTRRLVVVLFFSFASFLVMSRLLAHYQSLWISLIGSVVSGLLALVLAVYLLALTRRAVGWALALLVAYLSRVVVGIVAYIGTIDPRYFTGNGDYNSSNWEFYWTHQMMETVASGIRYFGFLSAGPESFFREDKNALIHYWGGVYYYSTQPYALNITAWNSFHHVWTGLLIGSIALQVGYRHHVALKSAVATAFIPWAFPSSAMWRDSVGLMWLVLAALLVLQATRKPFINIILLLPAFVMAFSDRYVYSLVVLFCFVVFFGSSDGVIESKGLVRITLGIGLVLLVAAVLTTQSDILGLISQQIGTSIGRVVTLDKFLLLPLRAVRGIMGPFPWLNALNAPKSAAYLVFDYAQHVFGLAVLIGLWLQYKRGLFQLDFLATFGFCILLVAIIARGVHTAYIAPAIPFLLPRVFVDNRRLAPLIVVSFYFFILTNIAYVTLGLWGTSSIMNFVGY